MIIYVWKFHPCLERLTLSGACTKYYLAGRVLIQFVRTNQGAVQRKPALLRNMTSSGGFPSLPTDLEIIFSTHNDPVTLIEAFMPALCEHIKADRIFIQPRNPDTRICKVIRWRRNENIPW